MALVYVGVLLEILAAALGTLSKQLIAISEHLKKPWLFHIGATINIAVGPLVDASAYAFAPQVIVAPFACLDVIFNALTAPYTLKWQNEVLTRAHFIGCGLVTCGASMTALFADTENVVYDVYMLEKQLLRPESLIYFTVELCGILTANYLLRRGLMTPMVRGISLGVIAGVLMGNVFFVKGLVSLARFSISTGDTQAWLRPTPYLMGGCAAGGAVIGHMFMRKGLGEYKGVFMVTIFEGAHITAACLSGCVVMSEMSGAPWWRYLCYWASVGTIIAGMLFINTAAADAELAHQRSIHIAQHFGPEEGEGLKEGQSPAPIGKGRSSSDADVELARLRTDSQGRNPLDGDGSPIGRSDSESNFYYDSATPSPQKAASPRLLSMGETSSNVSTSTPEADLIEIGQNGNNEPAPCPPIERLTPGPPVFTGIENARWEQQ